MESRSRPDANERPGCTPTARDVAPAKETNERNDTAGALTVPLVSFCAAACPATATPGKCPYRCPSFGGAQ
jgi:hypothetical protein